ncbi:MAG: multimeric flavodoxin WrbA [Granulosicoccus sp.]|jgi:multimeric flavodoxin WrbA
MKKDILLIFGSARADGNTRTIADFLLEKMPNSELMNLQDFNFSGYDYEHKNAGDDFFKMAEHMLTFDKIIFCTPVYWYSMSSIMKRFLDRWSDLVTIRKEKGRGLAGKKLFALCCSSDEEEHEGFFMPFEKTAGYLEMVYGGKVHTYVVDEKIPVEVQSRLVDFCNKITV